MPDIQRWLTALLIVGGNSIVFYGIAEWGWRLFDILFLYWFENVVVGFITLGRFLAVPIYQKWYMIFPVIFTAGFFSVHYGMFTFGHGAILVSIFLPEGYEALNIFENTYGISFADQVLHLFQLPEKVGIDGFVMAAIGICLVQLAFGIKDLIKDIQNKPQLNNIMGSPYGRIIILHITILLGGTAMQAAGSPIAALFVFVALKIMFDLAAANSDKLITTKKGDDDVANPT